MPCPSIYTCFSTHFLSQGLASLHKKKNEIFLYQILVPPYSCFLHVFPYYQHLVLLFFPQFNPGKAAHEETWYVGAPRQAQMPQNEGKLV